MDLHDALGQISEIRAQVARTETFRGFRSVTVGFSGVLGIAAGLVQNERIAQPAEHVQEYVELWLGVAILSVLVVGVELGYRWAVESSSLKRRLTVLAIQQFAPCLVAGGALTVVIADRAPASAWMLPGLWAILFSLGVFASCRLLPAATAWVGVYYLGSGTLCLTFGNGPHALAPWFMMGTFGVGQLLSAAILYFTLERKHEPRET
jgi:hypothetical protein